MRTPGDDEPDASPPPPGAQQAESPARQLSLFDVDPAPAGDPAAPEARFVGPALRRGAPLVPPSRPVPRPARARRPSRDPGLPRGASDEDQADLAALREEYERLRGAWGFGPAAIRLSRRRLTGGVIHYGHPHRIDISLHMSPVERRETLLHEIAHAICWTRDGDAREGHGPRFWEIARALGVRRRSAPETEALRFHRENRAVHVYRCEGCGAEWRRFRPFGRSMLCASCHRRGRPARLRKIRAT